MMNGRLVNCSPLCRASVLQYAQKYRQFAHHFLALRMRFKYTNPYESSKKDHIDA